MGGCCLILETVSLFPQACFTLQIIGFSIFRKVGCLIQTVELERQWRAMALSIKHLTDFYVCNRTTDLKGNGIKNVKEAKTL